MKLVSSYEHPEHHDRSLRESEAHTALADVKLEQDTLAAMALALCHLIEDADCLEDIDMAEHEATELLSRIRKLRGSKNHAVELLRGLRK